MDEHEVRAVEKNRMLCTCGLWLEGESTWEAMLAGSRHAQDMAA